MTAVHIETHGTTLVIRIDRPEALNALDFDAMKAVREGLTRLDSDDNLRVGVLTGTGSRAFCVGADLKKTSPPATPYAGAYFRNHNSSVADGLYIRAIALDSLHLTKPLIAAVNGHCLGGGMEMALACDIRIGSQWATFGLPEAKIGSVPAIGGTSLLLRAVPTAIANKMLLTGDRVDAAEAYRVGLISDLVEHEELMTRAFEIADRISSNGPLAVRAIKSIARHSADLSLTQSIRQEELFWGMLRDTADRIEGRAAFAEKRAPRWTEA
nr:enoyl-CoA hydratase-related protein [Rhodococcus sp. (in: high G+C Gram-positive bacteria)]